MNETHKPGSGEISLQMRWVRNGMRSHMISKVLASQGTCEVLVGKTLDREGLGAKVIM